MRAAIPVVLFVLFLSAGAQERADRRLVPPDVSAAELRENALRNSSPSSMDLVTRIFCVQRIFDQANGGCLEASSAPTFGMLLPYPGTNNVFDASTGALVVGGMDNEASGPRATVSGGRFNLASGELSTVGGGGGDVSDAGNTADGRGATVAGGLRNSALGTLCTVGGGAGNMAVGPVASLFLGNTVAGGSGNTASGTISTVGGGSGNSAANRATVGGGLANNASGDDSSIGGGANNVASGSTSRVCGGNSNRADNTHSVVSGGIGNTSSGYSSTVSGGFSNRASGYSSTVSGGSRNVASGSFSTVSGGGSSYSPPNVAGGDQSTVPGGSGNNALGAHSFAAGRRAIASHDGAFVWGDSQDLDKPSSISDEFSVYASGGARFFSNSAATTGVLLAPGGGSWTAVSDRAAKENVEPVDARAVLERVAQLPLATWNYKEQSDSIRHMGPMAQDFYAAFGLGLGETTIDTIDPDGVALAAIQGLHGLLSEKEDQIAALEANQEKLQDQVAQLIQRLETLEARD